MSRLTQLFNMSTYERFNNGRPQELCRAKVQRLEKAEICRCVQSFLATGATFTLIPARNTFTVNHSESERTEAAEVTAVSLGQFIVFSRTRAGHFRLSEEHSVAI